jgi:type I restriction enzyme M protein
MENVKHTKSSGLISTEYSNPVDSITYKVMNAIESIGLFPPFIRDEDSIQIALLYVSLYKDSIINEDILNNDFSVDQLKSVVIESELDNKTKQAYFTIIVELNDTLEKAISHLQVFILYLFNIEKELLIEYFPAVFDDTIYRIAQSQGKYSAEEIQPVELTRFMSGLIELKPYSRVFNPFGGLASFGLHLNENQSYYGQEIRKNRWILGILRLMAYGKLANSNYDRVDSIEDWSVDVNYDCIFTTPPFGMRIDMHDAISNKYFKSGEHFVIEKGIQTLSPGGKMVAAFSNGILFRGGSEMELRKQLIEKDLIDSIISFPGGLFQHTAIPFVVMVLSKDKKLQNKVRFIKADNYVVEKNRREKVLHDELLLNVCNGDVDFSDDIRLIDNEVLRENEYNLSINRYFEDAKSISEIPEGATLVKLGELVNTFSRGFTDQERAKVINISDLAESIENFEKQVSDFEHGNIPISAQKIESSVLLLSKIRSLKPTYCKVVEGELVYCNNNIIPLLVDESKVFIPYLILELNSERVSRFVKSRLTGISIPTLNKKDILEIPILLSSIEIQKAKFESAIQSIIKSKEKALKLEKEMLGIKEDAFREFASIKHTFRQYLSALKSNVVGTKKFIAKHNGKPVFLDEIYSKNLGETFGEHLDNIDKTIDLLSNLLNTDKFETTTVERLNFLDLVKEAQNCFKFDSFKYNEVMYDIITFEDSEIVPLEPIIEINSNDFFRLFSNIVSNAMYHGFKDSDKQYIIQSSISFLEDNEGYFVLDVSNNGRPLPEEFTFKHLTTRGEKTTDSNGAGIGGADIKDIVDKYNGKFELINDSKSTFPVTYRISFPIFNLD